VWGATGLDTALDWPSQPLERMKLAGIDLGGTFTDIIFADLDTKKVSIYKVPSMPGDPSQALIDGVAALDGGVRNLDFLVHGTTLATNALLTYDGAKVGVITTRGYRDILHIARHQRPLHYSIRQEVPWQDRPLARRRHRSVVSERLGPKGEVIVPLVEEEVRHVARELREAGVEAIVVAFINSYRNPVHEERAQEIVQQECPELFVTTSSSLFPQFREYERFSTAAINAFVGPKVRAYLRRLEDWMDAEGTEAELRLMRSNGGAATSEFAANHPVTLLLSGPAGGVLAAQRIGSALGRNRVISFDMGGTSADIGIITPSGVVEAAARDTWVAGYPVLAPMIDIHTVGAGGGSIAYVDSGGAFRVGPRSAGAEPGPAAYGRGGMDATVTDANLVLGRLVPDHFLGGKMTLEPRLAHEAVTRLAEHLGLGLLDAAAGALTIVNQNMATAIRSRTIQKGHDPREFSLMAFGGAGPLHAVDVARSLDIPEVIVPMYPGLTSAFGLLSADLKYDLIRNEFMLHDDADLDRLNDDFDSLDREARQQLDRDGVGENERTILHAADCRYVGQGYELRVPMPTERLNPDVLDGLWLAFHQLHNDEYGRSFPNNPIELVNIRVVAIGEMPKIPRLSGPREGTRESALVDRRSVYFHDGSGLAAEEAAFYERARLPVGACVEGPAILLQVDSTVVVPPDSMAEVLGTGDLIIKV
jgi:N-methylhydantoinase A